MIVDDNIINQECLKKILNLFKISYEVKIIESNDGDKAVDTFKKHNELKNKDNILFIIMDFNMTRMHGDTATLEVSP